MRKRGPSASDQGKQRALDRRGVKDDHSPRVAAAKAYPEGAVCPGCGAVYARKTWRRPGERLKRALATGTPGRRCPACAQVKESRSYGRVILRGAWIEEHEEEARRRIANVEARARHTQPQRRVVEVGRVGRSLEVMSTSQKLAHRIVRELDKAFGGRSTYKWSDRDGSLTAVWTHD